MTAMPDAENRFSGEVFATAVEDGALIVTIGGLRKTGYRPAAGETLTVIPAPPSVSTIRSQRSAVARLYKRRFSWLSQGATPTAARRPVSGTRHSGCYPEFGITPTMSSAGLCRVWCWIACGARDPRTRPRHNQTCL